MRHQGEAERVQERADAQHPHRAEAIGDRAGERLRHAPQQVLDREREREHVAAPAIGAASGVRKKPSAERGPKASSAIAQPANTISPGVRQPGAPV